MARDDAGPWSTPDSIGQPDSMRNEEQRLRDNQGGSELTTRPDDHPEGALGETVSAEAEGPPPDRVSNIGAPVRSAGPEETTLPEESPLTHEGREQDVSPVDDERGK